MRFPHGRPIAWPMFSALMVLVGASLLLRPEDYGPGYRYHFDLIPQMAWGILFLFVGLFCLGARVAPEWNRESPYEYRLAWWLVLFGSVLYGTWAACFIPGLTGDEPRSINPVLSWGAIALVFWLDFAINGPARARR